MNLSLRVFDVRMQRLRDRTPADPPALLLHHESFPAGIASEVYDNIRTGQWPCPDQPAFGSLIPHRDGLGQHVFDPRHRAPRRLACWQENDIPGIECFDLDIYGGANDIYGQVRGLRPLNHEHIDDSPVFVTWEDARAHRQAALRT